MSTLNGTTIHPRCRFRERRFKDANLSKHKIVHVVNTDTCWEILECLWIALESRPMNVHSGYKIKKLFTKHDGRNTQVNMCLKKSNFWLLMIELEDLSNQVPISTNVGLILTKLSSFQHFGTSQNSITTFFESKIKLLGFHAIVLLKTFPLMYQLLLVL